MSHEGFVVVVVTYLLPFRFAKMGIISNFNGCMHMEMSFLVDGAPFKASMVREKTNKMLGSETGKTEKIAIRLFVGERSIFVQRYQEGEGSPLFR